MIAGMSARRPSFTTVKGTVIPLDNPVGIEAVITALEAAYRRGLPLDASASRIAATIGVQLDSPATVKLIRQHAAVAYERLIANDALREAHLTSSSA